MARVTFSLDDATVAQIRQTAARLRKAQSHVVRDAVADYAARSDRLSERERLHVLGVIDRLRSARPTSAMALCAGSTNSAWLSTGLQKRKLWPQCACMAKATFSSTVNSGNTEVI